MKQVSAALLVVVFAAILASIPGWSSSRKEGMQTSRQPAGGSFIVMELFTSEGCSSCPMADELLPKLAAKDSNYITLSYHVDYWDRLGWKDPYSDHQYSVLQTTYNSHFGLEGNYTPQLVINGEYEVVGNVRSRVEHTIEKAGSRAASTFITIKEVSGTAGQVQFRAEAYGETKDIELEAMLVQLMARNKIGAGENEGAVLSHFNIVRSLQKKAAGNSVDFSLKIPAGLHASDWQLVVLARQSKTLKITGATNWRG